MNINGIIEHIVRLGTVTAVYDETGHVQVTFFDRDEEPRDLPFFSWFYEYNMPDLNDTVLCVFLPFQKEGFAIGKWWSDSLTPPTGIKRTVWYKKLRKKANISFDDETETLTINAKNIVLNGTLLTVNADVIQKGDFSQTGNISTSGKIIATDKITSEVDVISGTISGKGHTHTDSMGGTCSTPN